MFLTYGVVAKAVLLVVGIGWCVYIIKRFPSDLCELRELWRRYATRNQADVLEAMRTEERRRHYRENCSTRFWSTLAVDVLFLWPVTAVLLILVVRFVTRGLIAPILSSFHKGG